MNSELKEWTVQYVKHKDMAQRKITGIAEEKTYLDIKYKDKTVRHYILDILDDKIIQTISGQENKVLVCPNVDENFKFLIKNWNKLSVIKNLNIIFVNMKSQEKWQINPKVHSMIADPDSIEQGLRTMYDTANGKIAELPKGKKKPQMFESGSSEEESEEETDS